MKILIVDSNPRARDALAQLLKDNGHTVMLISTRSQAIDMLCLESDFELAIINRRLNGGRDGIDILRALNAVEWSTRFWVISDDPLEETDVQEALALCAGRIIHRSYLLGELKTDKIVK